MAAPNGALAKLYFNAEPGSGAAGGYGSLAAINANTGYQLYYDNLADQTEKRPLDFQEISGTSVDYISFVESEISAGFTLEYSMRFSPVHMLLAGLSMGDLSFASGTIAPFSFFALLHDNLDSASFYHQVPYIRASDGTTQVDEFRFVGCKVQRSTWSHRVGEPMKHRMECIASFQDWNDAPTGGPTEVNNVGRWPLENLIMWSHRDALKFRVDPLGTNTSEPNVDLDVRSWEITLDNALVPNFLIQEGRKSGEPIRDDFRQITLRMEIEQNDGWREMIRLYGRLSTDAPQFAGVKMIYNDPTSTNDLTIDVGNIIFNNVPRGIPGPGRLFQTITGRAHRLTNGVPDSEPLKMLWNVPYLKPAQGAAPPNNYGEVITP